MVYKWYTKPPFLVYETPYLVYETPLFGIQTVVFSRYFLIFFVVKGLEIDENFFFWIFTLLCFRYVCTKKTQRFFVCFPAILPHFCFSVCCTLCCVFTKVLYLLQGILLRIYNLFKVFFKKVLTFCKWIWYHKCVHERDFVLKNW